MCFEKTEEPPQKGRLSLVEWWVIADALRTFVQSGPFVLGAHCPVSDLDVGPRGIGRELVIQVKFVADLVQMPLRRSQLLLHLRSMSQ